MEKQELRDVASEILDRYSAIASGSTNGGGGGFYADGKGTLCSITLPVEMLERLAVACGRTVYDRTEAVRNSK